MSRSETITCDRCGESADTYDIDRTKWARVFGQTISGRDVIGDAQTAADLCGACVADLEDFMAATKAK